MRLRVRVNMVGESRSELLQWINSTLNLNYTKVEACGTGAVYCQLFDSIYGDVPMNRVKFNTTNDYDYRSNMKILQQSFSKHGITKSVDVEKLIKCKLQDNLELLQWFRKYWIANKDLNSEYDPVSRRQKRSTSRLGQVPSRSRDLRSPSPTASTDVRTIGPDTAIKPVIGKRIVSNPVNSNKLAQMNKELADTYDQIKLLSDELEKCRSSYEASDAERVFYYNKLRQIEILVSNTQNSTSEASQIDAMELTNEILMIITATADGFEATDYDQVDLNMIDQETF